MENKLIRIKQVQLITSLSKSYIYQLCNLGKFPKPVQLIKGGTGVAWVESEISNWVKSRISNRDQEVSSHE